MGADNSAGLTALHKAIAQGHLEVTQALLSAGAAVNQADNDGWTALHYAAARGHLEVTQALLSAGADLDMLDSDGRTALDIAADRDQMPVVLALHEHVVQRLKLENKQLRDGIRKWLPQWIAQAAAAPLRRC